MKNKKRGVKALFLVFGIILAILLSSVLVEALAATCLGTAKDCNYFDSDPSSSRCRNQESCSWSRAFNINCYGTAKPCNEFYDESSCNNQAGCSWQPAIDVDVISNSDEWYYCNAQPVSMPGGADHGTPVPEYGTFEMYNFEVNEGGLDCPLQLCVREDGELQNPPCCDGEYYRPGYLMEDCRCIKEDGTTLYDSCASFPTAPNCQGDETAGETDGDYIKKSECTNENIQTCIAGAGGKGDITETCSEQANNLNYALCSKTTEYCKDSSTFLSSEIINNQICCVGLSPSCGGFSSSETCGAQNGYLYSLNTELCDGSSFESAETIDNPNLKCCIGTIRLQGTYLDQYEKYQNESFICYKENRNNLFAECCYPGKCNNKDKGIDFRIFGQGTMLHALQTFDSYNPTGNLIVDYVWKKTDLLSTTGLIYLIGTINLEKSNWTGYDNGNLEFDIAYSNSMGNITIITCTECDAEDWQQHDIGPLRDYINNRRDEPFKWHHIIVPISVIKNKLGISDMGSVKVREVKIKVPPGQEPVDAVVDNFYLSLPSSTTKNSRTYFCSGWFSKWLDELDPLTDGVLDGLGNVIKDVNHDGQENDLDIWPYRFACNAQLAFGWTGTQCCGDDQIHDYNNETYIDIESGCWEGYIVREDTVVEIGSNLLYLNEMFHACGLNGTAYQDLRDGSGLVHGVNITNEDPGTLMGSWFCDFDYNWKDTDSSSARTKALALQLLNFSESESPNNYTLFCDSYSNALNEYDYILDSTWAIFSDETIDYLNDAQINSICVLKYGEEVAIGTSINNNIDDDDSFLVLLNKSQAHCDSLSGNGPYYICSGDQSVWYNNKTKSIIYDKGEINLESTENFISRLIKLIADVLGFYSPPVLIPMVGEFDKIYVNKLGIKEINGIMGSNFIKVSYYNLDINISKAVKKLEEPIGQPLFNYEYNSTNNVHIISSDKTQALGHWQELTSKIRLK